VALRLVVVLLTSLVCLLLLLLVVVAGCGMLLLSLQVLWERSAAVAVATACHRKRSTCNRSRPDSIAIC
jgi:hypothetical protein